MAANDLKHGPMTTKQQQLFLEMQRLGTPNDLAAHTVVAREALMAGGASEELADALLKEAISDLVAQGVKAPTHLPWSTK